MIQQQKDGRPLMQEAQRIVAKYGPSGLYRGLVRCAPALLLPTSSQTASHSTYLCQRTCLLCQNYMLLKPEVSMRADLYSFQLARGGSAYINQYRMPTWHRRS